MAHKYYRIFRQKCSCVTWYTFIPISLLNCTVYSGMMSNWNMRRINRIFWLSKKQSKQSLTKRQAAGRQAALQVDRQTDRALHVDRLADMQPFMRTDWQTGSPKGGQTGWASDTSLKDGQTEWEERHSVRQAGQTRTGQKDGQATSPRLLLFWQAVLYLYLYMDLI